MTAESGNSRVWYKSTRRKLLGYAAVVGLAGLGSALSYAKHYADPNAGLLLASGILVFAIAAFPTMFGRFPLGEPPTFIALSVFLGVTGKIWYVLSARGDSVVEERLLRGEETEVLFSGVTAVLLGVSAFTAGYLFPQQRLASTISFQVKRSVNGSLLLPTTGACLLVATGAILWWIAQAGIPADVAGLSGKRFLDGDAGAGGRVYTESYYIYRAALLSRVALYVLLAAWFEQEGERRGAITFLIAIAAAESVFVAYFFSNRAGLLVTVIDFLVLGYIVTGKIDKRAAIALVGVALAGVLYMSVVRAGDTVGVFQPFFGGRYFLDVTKTAHIIDFFTEAPKLNGQTFVGWFLWPVPAGLLHDKPMFLEMGRFIGREVYGSSVDGVPPGVVGELFMNFGWIGIALGMAVLGFVSRSLVLNLRRGGIVMSLVYALVVVRIGIFWPNNDFGTAILRIFADLGPVLGCLWIICGTQIVKKRL